MLKKNIITYAGHAVRYPLYKDMPSFFYNLDIVVEIINKEFDNRPLGLVCTGTSGMCVATALVQRNLNWHVFYIRKDDDNSHAVSSFHTDRHDSMHIPADMHLVFVDDLISSGDTLLRCCEFLKEKIHRNIETVILMDYSLFSDNLKERFKKARIKMPIRIISAE